MVLNNYLRRRGTEYNQLDDSLDSGGEGSGGGVLGNTVGGYFSNKDYIKYRNSYQNLDSNMADQRLRTRINNRYLNIPSEVGEVTNNLVGDYYYSSIKSADGSSVSMPLEREDFEGTENEYLDYKLKEIEWMLLQTQAVANNLNIYANYITEVLSDRIKVNKIRSMQNSRLLNNSGSFKADNNSRLLLLIAFLLLALLLKQFNVL